MRIKQALKKTTVEHSNGKTISKSNPKNINEKENVRRVDRKELEEIYITDPIIFNGINKISNVIGQAGYSLQTQRVRVNKFYQEWIRKVGKRGGHTSWNRLVEAWTKQICKFGIGFGEIIPDSETDKAIDVDFINPVNFDYIKPDDLSHVRKKEDKEWLDKYVKKQHEYTPNSPILDEDNNPIGYVQRLKRNFKSGQPRRIFFKPRRVLVFKFHHYGSGLYPVGLIEPVYKTTLRKLNIEEARAESQWAFGDPIIISETGDEQNEPVPEMLKSTTNILSRIKSDRVAALPYYAKVKVLNPGKDSKMDEELNHFISSQAAGMGVPKAFISETGESSNKGTLGFHTRVFRDTLKNIQEIIREEIETKLFERIKEDYDLNERPDLVPGHVSIEDRNKQSKRINESVKNGIIQPTPELEQFIATIEGLPTGTSEKTTTALSEGYPLLVVREPLGSMAFQGEITMFLRKHRRNDVVGRMFEIVENGKNLCRCVITGIQEVKSEDFMKLLPQHGVTDIKRKEELTNGDKFYAYHFRIVFKYPTPRPIGEKLEEGFYENKGVTTKWEKLQ